MDLKPESGLLNSPASAARLAKRVRMRANADRKMAVHRIIEANATKNGDMPALMDAGLTLSYKELNQRANAMARSLLAQGFRRGGVATVCLPCETNTAVVLLAVLKAGGTYVLLDPATAPPRWPRGVYFADKADADEVRYRMVDIASALAPAHQSSANLPVVARLNDVACVIADADGEPRLLVPHATIMALKREAAPRFVEWSAETGALDLWAALMSGATVKLSGAALRSAA